MCLPHLVRFDMSPESCTPLFCVLVHKRTVLREQGAIYDDRRGPDGMERLALVLVDELLLLGLCADVEGCLRLDSDDRHPASLLLWRLGGRQETAASDEYWSSIPSPHAIIRIDTDDVSSSHDL